MSTPEQLKKQGQQERAEKRINQAVDLLVNQQSMIHTYNQVYAILINNKIFCDDETRAKIVDEFTKQTNCQLETVNAYRDKFVKKDNYAWAHNASSDDVLEYLQCTPITLSDPTYKPSAIYDLVTTGKWLSAGEDIIRNLAIFHDRATDSMHWEPASKKEVKKAALTAQNATYHKRCSNQAAALYTLLTLDPPTGQAAWSYLEEYHGWTHSDNYNEAVDAIFHYQSMRLDSPLTKRDQTYASETNPYRHKLNNMNDDQVREWMVKDHTVTEHNIANEMHRQGAWETINEAEWQQLINMAPSMTPPTQQQKSAPLKTKQHHYGLE